MPIPSSDDSRPDTLNNSQGSRRISQEIANLQQDIRDDFDQKLKELSGLMHKFRSLLANDGQLGTDLPPAANQATLDGSTSHTGVPADQLSEQSISDALANIPVLTDRVGHASDTPGEPIPSVDKPGTDIQSASVTNINSITNSKRNKEAEDSQSGASSTPSAESAAGVPVDKKQAAPVSRFSTEPARFEAGLYQLNSQLYRFKLELDQELEFREEPLHIHFQHQSELAKVLQQITEKMQREKNVGR